MDKKKNRFPWKYLFVILAIVGAGGLLLELLMPWVIQLLLPDAASIGIIGGADGPTAVFVTTTLRPRYYDLVLTGLLITGLWGIWRFRK